MFWDWDYTWEIMPILAEASIVTIEATVLGFILAAVVGLLLAILRMSPRQWVSLPAAGFVEFVRSTPLLIQIFFIYFVLPEFGITLGALTAGILALGLHSGRSDERRVGKECVRTCRSRWSPYL